MHLLNAKPICDNVEETLRVLAARSGLTTAFTMQGSSEASRVCVERDGLVRVMGEVAPGDDVPSSMLAANPHAAYFAKVRRVQREGSDTDEKKTGHDACYRIGTLERQQKRQSLRGTAPHDWHVVAQDCVSPQPLTIALVDVSMGGLGGHVCVRHYVAQVGTAFASLRLSAPTLQAVRLSGHGSRIWTGPMCDACGGTQYIGISVRGETTREQTRFVHAICGVLFPNITAGCDESEAIWSVLDEAGYFDLSGKDAQAFAKRKNHYLQFNERLGRAPALGHQLAWQTGGQAVASIASCRAFSRAHLLHHLGKVNKVGQDKTSLRDILVCSVELTKHDDSVDWICAYLNKAVPFHRQSAIPFATFFAKQDQAACLALQLFEVDAASTAAASWSTTPVYEVRSATSAQCGDVAATLRRRFGRCFCEAFDRTEQTLDGAGSRRAWADVGLERRRDIFVAVDREGRPAAAAIVEMASTGSTLFHIFDAMTVTRLDDSISEEALSLAHEALLQQSARWFLQHGVRRFITPVFAAESSLQAPRDGTDLGSGALWIVERSLFCCLQEYWHLQL